MNPTPIDLWDLGTFDPELIAFLKDNAELIRAYVETENHIFLTYDYGRERTSLQLRPENPHARAYIQLQEDVGVAMQLRTIRAFHYTRLIDSEVEAMLRDGIHLSTPATLRSRLDTCVAHGLLTTADADALYATSPFHEQMTIRAGRFWLTSHPLVADDSGVSPLLQHWGGEVTYMYLQNETLITKVQAIGTPRIIEAAVPLNLTTASCRAGESVLVTFARSQGCVASKHAIDVCATTELPPKAVLAVHTGGQDIFSSMGQGYPAGFVDVDLTHWKDLTGEDDPTEDL